MMQIKQSYDYDKFVLISKNRQIYRAHVEKLKRSIQFNNMLHMKPIMVNENWEVMDGQHRLSAAQELGVPIYYVMDASVKEADIIPINNTMKVWTLIDYYTYYSNSNCPEYLKIKELAAELNMPLADVIAHVAGNGRRSVSFKAGEFKLDNKEDIINEFKKLDKVIEVISKFLTFHERAFTKNKFFRRAMNSFIKREDVDFDIFLRKVEMGINRLRVCSNVSQYHELFTSLYNFRNSNPIE